MDEPSGNASIPGRQTLKRRRGLGLVAGAVVVAALVGAVAWRRGLLGASTVAPLAAPIPIAPTTPTAVPSPAAAPLNPTASKTAPSATPDVRLRDLAGGLSSDPTFATWLGETGLVHRLVAAVGRVAEGESPAPLISFLAPREPFKAVQHDGKPVASPETFARYDAFTRIATSMDPARAAAIYMQLRPSCQAAFAPIARPGAQFDAALHTAIDGLLSTPVPEGDVVLRETGATGYAYADPALEGLTSAQKQLLRMGPRNARAMQSWLRAFEAALPAGR